MKSNEKVMTIRLPECEYEAIKRAAARDQRSINQYVRRASLKAASEATEQQDKTA